MPFIVSVEGAPDTTANSEGAVGDGGTVLLSTKIEEWLKEDISEKEQFFEIASKEETRTGTDASRGESSHVEEDQNSHQVKSDGSTDAKAKEAARVAAFRGTGSDDKRKYILDHLSSSTGETDPVCAVCFKKSLNLKEHMKLHMNFGIDGSVHDNLPYRLA